MKLVKMQTAAKQREFLKHVNLKNTDKILSLIHKGLDPNFHDENGEGDLDPLYHLLILIS